MTNKQKIPRRGFITLGINSEQDNVRYCYGLACSIKKCDPDASVTLVVDKENGNVQSYYEHAFDYIVELPTVTVLTKMVFHGMNLWQMYHCFHIKTQFMLITIRYSKCKY